MSEDLKSKVIDTIDSLIPKGQNSLSLREADMAYGIYKAKEAVEKLFAEISTQDCISRQAAIEALRRAEALTKAFGYHNVIDTIRDLPPADIDLSDYSDRLWRKAYEQGKADAEPERKKGKWLEREVIHAKEAKAIITEWQSCKCSVCGCYDTRPYLYCFNEPSFCSWCGAEMKGVSDE